jgi:ABC-type multidrug transport system ATPase subunit
MEGRLTLYCARTGKREPAVLLPKTKVERTNGPPPGLRGGLIVGAAADCGLVISEPGCEAYKLVFSWTDNHATWRVSNLSSAPLYVDNLLLERNGTPLAFWETNLRFDGLDVQLKFERQPSLPLLNGRPVVDVPLTGLGLEIGRGSGGAGVGIKPRLCLDDDLGSIAPFQCEIVQKGGDFILINRNLEKPEWRTLYNGIQDYDEVKLVIGDCIQTSGCEFYTFKFTGNSLRHIGHAGVLKGEDLSVEVGGGRKILHAVDLEVHRGKFLGIIGGSGQGKSTFLNAICGIVPATSGKVSVDGLPIRSPQEVADVGIGYVPQDDIVHKELVVDDALYYAAKLRLSASESQIRDVIQATLDVLDLAEHRKKRIFQLSGGQRKRVSIASELLVSPDYLFLDEPTSGLDPQTEKSLMGALAQLAIRRRMGVVCTTHVLQNAGFLERMAYISRGRLIFHSRPVDAARFFLNLGTSSGSSARSSSIISSGASGSDARVSASASGIGRRDDQYSDDYLLDKIKLIYDRAQDLKDTVVQQDQTAEEWVRKYKSSPFFIAPTEEKPHADAVRAPKSKQMGALKNLQLLISRQWKLLISAKLNYLFLLMQAILIGVMVAWVDENVVLHMFLTVIATLWFGCSNGAQQIVAELPIFRRERLAGLGIHTYLLSKFLFLTAITAVQAMILFFMVVAGNHWFHPEEDDTKDNPPPAAVASMPESDYERNIPDDEIPDHLGKLRPQATRAFRSQFFNNKKWSILAKGDDGLSLETPDPATMQEAAGEGTGVVGPLAADGYSGVIDFGDTSNRPKVGGAIRPEPRDVTYNPSGLRVTDTAYLWLERLAWFFNLRENVIGTLAVTTKENLPPEVAEMVESSNGTLSWKRLIFNIVGLRIAALLLAAMVGVGLGLAVSSLVNTPTQAVMWVPLILIPQILFGAFVVVAPDMKDGVLLFSRLLPSFNLQRIMDVSLIHGQSAGRMTNKSKVPAFISPPPGDEETVRWVSEDGEKLESSYDRISDANKSWQNLTVERSLIGQRVKVLDEASRTNTDTVEFRRDVRVRKGDVFKSLADSYLSASVLGIWVISCYGVATFSLYRRQTGR